MRIEFKAILASVREVEIKEKYTRQQILLQVPVYDSFTGEQTRVENYPATILNKNVERLNASELLGEVVKCTCFLTSFKNEQKDNIFWNLSLTVVELSIIKPN